MVIATTPQRDRANFLVFPPALLLAIIVVSSLLQWVAPPGVLSQFDQSWRFFIGGGILLSGLVLTQAGARTLLWNGTNVNPLKPTVALATDGIYRWSRNPMYVGGTPLMLGIAVVFGIDWLPLMMIPGGLLLHFGIVRREERYLAAKFGDEYRRYCARVPRYLPGLAPGYHPQES